jgi:hypothetical protein
VIKRDAQAKPVVTLNLSAASEVRIPNRCLNGGQRSYRLSNVEALTGCSLSEDDYSATVKRTRAPADSSVPGGKLCFSTVSASTCELRERTDTTSPSS